MWNIKSPFHVNSDEKTGGEEAQIRPPEAPNNRPQWKQRLLDDFSLWLDELDEPPERGAEEPGTEGAGEEPDFKTLLHEFTALRQEVRLQSRAGSRVGDLVEGLAEELSEKLRRVEDIEATLNNIIPGARKESKRKTVEFFFEVVEGIRRTADSMAKESLPLLITGASRKREMERLAQPLRLLNGKVEEAMRHVGLEELVVEGEEFDSGNMRVVTTSQTGKPGNTVTEILCQGYRLDGDLIRAAEVVVEQSEEEKNE